MKFSRRTALRCGLAGFIVAASPAWAAGSTACPPGPMQLVRRVERGLHDGKTIVTERQWLVDFEARDAGIAITGEQISVSVDAPPKLARLVALEEQRDTSSMFPIHLTPDGAIVDGGDASDPRSIAKMMKAALEMIERAGLDPDDHRANIAAIQAASAQLLDTMPRDLFFPKAGAWTDRRTLALPGGATGVIAVRYEAKKSAGAPWLGRADRAVTTTVADTSRTSRETWTLSRS